MSGNLEMIFQRNVGGGTQQVFKHYSYSTKCDMKFSIFLPDKVSYDEKFHVLFFLAGHSGKFIQFLSIIEKLQNRRGNFRPKIDHHNYHDTAAGASCNEQHFLNRTDFHEHASTSRFVVVCPDTSPRVDLPGDSVEPLVGKSASWYIDATQEPFARNYKMFTYVSKELYDIVLKNFPVIKKFAISGHSMGGSGAICIGLRNPERFPSISLFAGNCNPIEWGHTIVFKTLLGERDKESWKLYDGSEVVKVYDGPRREILADQGTEDEYLKTLLPEKLVEAAKENPKGTKVISVNLRMHQGLDHGFNFVKRFWKDHFAFHARNLFLESQGLF